MFLKCIFRILMILHFCLASLATAAFALNVPINTNGYSGRYNISSDGVPLFTDLKGDQTVSLAASNYRIAFAPGVAVDFSVTDNAGSAVIASRNPDAIQGGNALTFQTLPISITTGPANKKYIGWYHFNNDLNNRFRGDKTAGEVRLIKALDNQIFGFYPDTSFRFDLKNNGDVVSHNQNAAQTGSRSIALQTVAVQFDHRQYTGALYIGSNLDQLILPGSNVHLVRDITHYALNMAPGTGFRFDVATNGVITSRNPEAASASGTTTLGLNTVPVRFGRSGFRGRMVVGVDTAHPIHGNGPIHLPPNITHYSLQFAPGVAFRFDVDAAGMVVSRSEESALGVRNRLVLKTVRIAAEPQDGYAGVFHFNQNNNFPLAGDSMFTLVRGVTNNILDVGPGTTTRFDIAADGTPDSPVIVRDSAGIDRTFNLNKIAMDCNPVARTLRKDSKDTSNRTYRRSVSCPFPQVAISGGFDARNYADRTRWLLLASRPNRNNRWVCIVRFASPLPRAPEEIATMKCVANCCQ